MSTFTRLQLFSCAALLFALVVTGGCGDPPADGVQVQIDGSLTDAQIDKIKKRLKRIDSGISRIGHTNIAGQITINLSPVDDVEKFAEKIRARPTHYGQLVDVMTSERIVVISVDSALLK